jgi:hypothetical protein
MDVKEGLGGRGIGGGSFEIFSKALVADITGLNINQLKIRLKKNYGQIISLKKIRFCFREKDKKFK